MYAAALSNGGSLSNVAPGIAYFRQLKQAGNFVPATGSAATVQSGQTPVLIWWDYLLASGVKAKMPGLKIVIPSDAAYAGYYYQAVSKTAPLRDLHREAGPGAAPGGDHRLGGVRELRRGAAGVPVHRLVRLGRPGDRVAGRHRAAHLGLGLRLVQPGRVVLVYLYFQVPLMVLVILPALEGLRPAWREAAENLGARGWQYWRHVGGPVLFPSFLGCVLLLFGSAMSAYATAEALTSGTIPLTSIQVGSFLNGNVIAGQESTGKALALGMIVIIAVVMAAYALLQRRAARWLR